MDAESGSYPFMKFQAGLGYGFTYKEQYGAIRIGLTEWGFYVKPWIPVSHKLILSGNIGIKSNASDLSSPQNHVSFGLRYYPKK